MNLDHIQWPEPVTVVTHQVARLIESQSLRIVFAESCTAGLLAGALSQIPGISEYLCGSMVVYQNQTKGAWLGVSAESLADPEIGAVSEQTAIAMAEGVLSRTPQADLAVSITGHLGPGAPPHLDGIAYMGLTAKRMDSQVHRLLLDTNLPVTADGIQRRYLRQSAAIVQVFNKLRAILQERTRG